MSSLGTLGTPNEYQSLPSWQAVGEADAPTWKFSGTQGTSAFWEKSEAPLPPKKRVCNYIHRKQDGPFPDRLKLPYVDEEKISGYEEDVSFKRYGFTAWVKANFETILERHVVDVRKSNAEFREASARRHDIFSRTETSTTVCPTALLYRKDSASTTGIQDLDVEGKEPSRSKLRRNGTSSRCKKQFYMLTTSFSRTGST